MKKLKPILETDPSKVGKDCTNCQLCQLHTACKAPFTPSHVPVQWDGKYFVVFPEPLDPRNGVTGMLWRAFGYYGIDPAYGYVNRCNSKQTIKINKVRLCYPFLKTDIQNLTPPKIIVFGEEAGKGVFDRKLNITDCRLKAYRTDDFFGYKGGWVFVVPNFEVYKGGKLSLSYFEFLKDMVWLTKFQDYIPRPANTGDKDYETYEAIDIEWGRNGRLLTLGQSRGVAANVEEEYLGQQLIELTAQDTTIVNHGLVGDCVALALNGFEVPEMWLTGRNIKDTLLGARLYNEHMPGYGIEDLVSSWCGIEPWKAPTEKIFKETQDFALIPAELRSERCRLDAFAAAKLYEFLEPKVDSVLWDFNNRLASTLKRIELAGMKLDPEVFRPMSTLGLALKTTRANSLIEFAADYGIELVPTNDNHFRHLLYDILKTPVQNLTASKLASVGSDDLVMLYETANDTQRHAIKLRLEHERIDKLYSTYLGNIDAAEKIGLAQHITPDWFVFPHINPIGARTGRRSSSDPNSQNLPHFVRKCFVSRFSNGVIWKFDHAQLEPRILAIIAGIEEWLEVFRKGLNFYEYCAKRMWGKEVHKGDSLYVVTKSAILGTNYGMEPPLFQQRALVDLGMRLSLQESADILKKYHTAFPGVPRFFLQQKEAILNKGYVETLTGHRYHIECPQGENTIGFKHSWNMALNAPVQGLASYITGSGLIDVETTLLRYYGVSLKDHFSNLVLHYAKQKGLDYSVLHDKLCVEEVDNIDYPLIINEVHDEIVLDNPEGDNDFQDLVTSTMQECATLRTMFPRFKEANIPLVVEATAARSWGG